MSDLATEKEKDPDVNATEDSSLGMAVVERVRQMMLQDEVYEAMRRELEDSQRLASVLPVNQRWQDAVEAGLQKAGLS